MLSKHLISSVLTQIPVFILGVVSGIFSTRILGDEAKGIFSLFQANSQLFVLLFSFGIQTGIVYFISSRKIIESKVLGMSLQIFGYSSFLLLIILILVHFFGFDDYILSREYSSLFYMLILFMMYFFTFLNSILNSFLQAHSKFRHINIVSFAGSFFNAIVFVLLFLFMNSRSLAPEIRLYYVLYCTLGGLAFNSLLWLFFYRRELSTQLNFSFDVKQELKPFVLYNSAIFLGTLINFLNYRLDLWIVNNFLPEKDLSYYSLAANINQIILYISVTISTVMLPNLSGRSELERSRIFVRVCRISFTFFICIISLAWLLSDWIIPFVYGEAFQPTVLPFKILLPGVLLSCSTQLFATLIVACKMNRLNIAATSIGLVITVILDICLIPIYGIVGAAYATVFSYAVIFISTFYLSLKKLNMPLTNYFFLTREDAGMIREQLRLLFK
jgi:O-antigen/teichoic acid export membrane protein